MQESTKVWILVTALALLIGISVGIEIGELHNLSKYRQQAIDHGYAEYDRATGEWQWVEPADTPAEQEARDE